MPALFARHAILMTALHFLVPAKLTLLLPLGPPGCAWAGRLAVTATNIPARNAGYFTPSSFHRTRPGPVPDA
jgi:hypothetical protein